MGEGRGRGTEDREKNDMLKGFIMKNACLINRTFLNARRKIWEKNTMAAQWKTLLGARANYHNTTELKNKDTRRNKDKKALLRPWGQTRSQHYTRANKRTIQSRDKQGKNNHNVRAKTNKDKALRGQSQTNCQVQHRGKQGLSTTKTNSDEKSTARSTDKRG